jgi:glycosyltransferase involved in cell wall biosynthesis
MANSSGLHPSTIHDTWMDPESEPGLVSIIVPTYNRAQFLPDLLRSVSSQTYRPIEFIVVDDGSTDKTADVVESFSQEVGSDDELGVHYFYQSNRGAPTARNRGLIESHGEFVQFLDSDDLLHPQKLEVHFRLLKRIPEADFAWSHIGSFTDGERPGFEEYEIEGAVRDAEEFEASLPGAASHPEGAFFRREACRLIGPWDENLERYQDWEYCFRIAALRLHGARIRKPFYYARHHEDSSIGSLRFGEKGVDRNLMALASIDRVIDVASRQELHAVAFRLYLNTLQRALASGTERQVRRTFRRATRHCSDFQRHLRLKGLEALYHLLGKGATRFVLKTYSRIQTGTAPAGNDPQS